MHTFQARARMHAHAHTHTYTHARTHACTHVQTNRNTPSNVSGELTGPAFFLCLTVSERKADNATETAEEEQGGVVSELVRYFTGAQSSPCTVQLHHAGGGS